MTETEVLGGGRGHQLLPGDRCPDLSLKRADGATWSVRDYQHRTAVVVMYRGYFCSVCRDHIASYAAHRASFAERSLDLIFVSADGPDLASRLAKEAGMPADLFGCEFNALQMREWGVFRSAGGDGRPACYAEPATFVLDLNNIVFWIAQQSLPWGSPRPKDLLTGWDFMSERGRPIRGSA